VLKKKIFADADSDGGVYVIEQHLLPETERLKASHHKRQTEDEFMTPMAEL
jgi:hypothetical protein